jgi:hypothetical protein
MKFALEVVCTRGRGEGERAKKQIPESFRLGLKKKYRVDSF